MKKNLSKKARKVIEENLAQFMQSPSLMELTKIGARMMLQSALEEGVRVFLDRDYYERNPNARGRRSGSKRRGVKVGCGDVEIRMPQENSIRQNGDIFIGRNTHGHREGMFLFISIHHGQNI